MLAGLVVVVCLLGACTDEGPHYSPRCQRSVDADVASRAAWQEALDADEPAEEVDRLHAAFLEEHEALMTSGCLVS
jgi:hypothetical protein